MGRPASSHLNFQISRWFLRAVPRRRTSPGGPPRAVEHRSIEGLFYAGEDLELIGEPLRQSFAMQFEVPMDEYRMVGADDGADLVRRHSNVKEISDHRRERISSRLGRARPDRRLAGRIRT